MTRSNGSRFVSSEWVAVIPKRRTGMFASPYLEPASIVARETGGELEECLGCGQLREDVTVVLVGNDECLMEVCGDCRREHGL